jgi:hypothetical protein
MRIRMKQSIHRGKKKESAFVERQPFPGCVKYKERLAAWNDRRKFGPGTTEYRARCKNVKTELGFKTVGNANPILEMHIRHGDHIIMHGNILQEIFYHDGAPLGTLRFALTCRTIQLKSLKPDNKPSWEVGGEDVRFDGLALPSPKMRQYVWGFDAEEGMMLVPDVTMTLTDLMVETSYECTRDLSQAHGLYSSLRLDSAARLRTRYGI